MFISKFLLKKPFLSRFLYNKRDKNIQYTQKNPRSIQPAERG